MKNLLVVILTFVSLTWLGGMGGADMHIKQPLLTYFASTKAAELSLKDYYANKLHNKIQDQFNRIDNNGRAITRLLHTNDALARQLNRTMMQLVRSRRRLSPEQINSFKGLYASIQEERNNLSMLLEELDGFNDYTSLWAEIGPAQMECDNEAVLEELSDIAGYQESVVERLNQAIEDEEALLALVSTDSTI